MSTQDIDRQHFLEALKNKIEKKYRIKKKKINDPKIYWTADALLELSVMIENYMENNPTLFLDIPFSKENNKKKDAVSVSTLERIFKSGETDNNGNLYEIYNVEEPLRPIKRKILNILSRFVLYENWNDFVYKNNFATRVYSEIVEAVDKLLLKDFRAYKELPVLIGYPTPQSEHPAKHAHLSYKSNLLKGFLLNFNQTKGWGWTINNPGNSSTCTITELDMQNINENPESVIFHIGVTYNLVIHSQTTQEFLENVIIKVVDRVHAIKKNEQWHFKSIDLPLSCMWLQSSIESTFHAHQSIFRSPDEPGFVSML